MIVTQSTRSLCVWACSTALVVLAPLRAGAQQATGSARDDQGQIEQLRLRIDELEQQVKRLQTAQSPGAPAEEKRATNQAAAGESADQAAEGTHDMLAPVGLGALQIRGFNDVNFLAHQDGDAPRTFSIGQLDLFLSSRLGSDFSTVGEIVFEASDENVLGVDVERILLQYSPSDRFTIAAGRFHTGIGYYNTAYHHGNWFQTATGRPFIFRFEDEGGLLPVHGVGVTVQGQIPSGRAGLRYEAEIGNGRTSRSPDDEAVQYVADENGRKAVNLALLARPAGIPGLQAGISVYRDRLEPAQQPAIDETIVAAHLVYQNPVFEQLNEAIFIRHVPADTERAVTTSSFYTQISRQFGRARPYFRYEYLDVPTADPIFSSAMGRSYGPSFGMRFDAAPPVAVKVEYTRLTGGIRSQTNGLKIQLGFTF